MPINEGLIGYWKFDENDGNEILDSSGNGNDGVLINGSRTEGLFGNAISLTGSDNSHGSIPASPSLNNYTNQITVTAWAFPTVPPDEFNPVVSRQVGTIAHPDQFYLGFGPQDGIEYKWHLGTDLAEGDIYEGFPDVNRWIHLAGTYDGSIMRLYVDGVEIGSQAISGIIPVDNNAITIGGEENGDIPQDVVGEFEGLIDEVRFYNRALTASEIQEIFTLEAIDPELPNDTIFLASAIALDSSFPVEITGEIGDNPDVDFTNDVDLFAVNLNAGDTLFADIDAAINGSTLDSVLTIFDADGDLLAQNDHNSFDDVTELDSFLEFTAPEEGTYYVGVSSSANLDYDPTVADSGVGNSSGSYSLELSLEEREDSSLSASITRFQNGDRLGTYLFAGPEESQDIRDNFANFIEEGPAFKVATESGDNLIVINRFQNLDVPGTYLYAGEDESQDIRENFSNMQEEGIAFYVYDGAADIGVDFYRFQNLDVPGTYIFVAEAERQDILNNFPNMQEEGVAFEVEL